jgi:hypothetical protein
MSQTQSRCIVIQMQRAKPSEQPEHMEDAMSDVLDAVRQQFARWAADLTALPKLARPKALLNRKGDNWRPLLRLAHLAGPRWHDLIMTAARADIARETRTEGTSLALLTDIRTVFGTRANMETNELISGLIGLQEPSGESGRCNSGGPVSAYYLRTHLRNLLNPPGAQRWWGADKNKYGYQLDQFVDSFERYLEPLTPAPAPAAASLNSAASATGATTQPSRETSARSGRAKKTHTQKNKKGGDSFAPIAPSHRSRKNTLDYNEIDQQKTSAMEQAPSQGTAVHREGEMSAPRTDADLCDEEAFLAMGPVSSHGENNRYPPGVFDDSVRRGDRCERVTPPEKILCESFNHQLHKPGQAAPADSPENLSEKKIRSPIRSENRSIAPSEEGELL